MEPRGTKWKSWSELWMHRKKIQFSRWCSVWRPTSFYLWTGVVKYYKEEGPPLSTYLLQHSGMKVLVECKIVHMASTFRMVPTFWTIPAFQTIPTFWLVPTFQMIPTFWFVPTFQMIPTFWLVPTFQMIPTFWLVPTFPMIYIQLIKSNLCFTAPKGAIPVNLTSAADWQMAVRRGNVISITPRKV